MMSKLSIAGVVFISLGIVSGLTQNIFYGYVDSDGILRDSLFLPFAFIFFGVGLIFLTVNVFRIIVRTIRRDH